MKRILLPFLSFILLIYLIPATSHAQDIESTHARVMIGYDNSFDLSSILKYTDEIHHVFDQIHVISATIPIENKSLITKLDHVKWIQDDPEVKAQSQVTNWGYSKVVSKESKNLGLTGEGVKIAVIDTGVNSHHADLHVSGGVSFVPNHSSFEDDNGHGTHVAGIIGALNNDVGVVGVAPDASLYAVKALDSEGIGNQADIIAGIEWSVENKMDIINLSLTSSEGSIALEEELKKAYDHGILVVAAAGNNEGVLPKSNDILYPARYSTVIGVGSIDQGGRHSWFSYTGKSLEVVAPGEDIYSTYQDPATVTNDDYALKSGTSMATPYVAGVLALYKQAYPSVEITKIRALMQQSTVDLGATGRDTIYGYGIVQAPKEIKPVPFADIKSDVWYTPYIKYLYEQGVIDGYPDGTFKPNSLVTRAEAVSMIGNTLELDGTLRETEFSDVNPASFASGYIDSATKQGIITGFPDRTFKPNDPIKRGDVAFIMQKSYHYPPTDVVAFKDIDPSKYYYDSVNSIKQARITSGYEDGTFKPENSITRAEFATLVAKQLNDQFK